MSFLFSILNKSVAPNPETLLIPPFDEIWLRDPSPEKRQAIKELSYIEFMGSALKSNPYKDYNPVTRHEVLSHDIFKLTDYQPDSLVLQAIDKLKEFQIKASASYSYYIAARAGAQKMQDFFLNVDINERHPKSGMPVYKPADITRALNDTERVLQNLKGLEKNVQEDLFENVRIKSNKTLSIFDDPNVMNTL